MAKRFIDTSFFKSPYVRGLEAPLKLLYGFIICDCSNAGIWVADVEIASVYCGITITKKQAEIFLETGKAVDLKNGKWFFPDFIQHQYPKGLQGNNPAHNNIIEELKSFNLIDENFNIKKIGAPKTLERPHEGSKDMDKETGKVEEMVTDKETGGEKVEIIFPFDSEEFKSAWQFWKDYRKSQHNFRYKSQSTEQIALKALAEKADNSEQVAMQIIQDSIANGWQGLFKPKDNGTSKTIPISRGQRQPNTDYRNAENYR